MTDLEQRLDRGVFYGWIATYKDGSSLKEFEADGSINKLDKIDQENLSKFGAFSLRTGETYVEVELQEGESYLWSHRDTFVLMGPPQSFPTITTVGSQVNGVKKDWWEIDETYAKHFTDEPSLS